MAKVLQKTDALNARVEGTSNRFTCFPIQSTNDGSKTSNKLYTDTDPDSKTEITAHVTIKGAGKPGTQKIGAESHCWSRSQLHATE